MEGEKPVEYERFGGKKIEKRGEEDRWRRGGGGGWTKI
jgi:hypothetical protein